jgi:hypothetical protein
VDGWQFSYNVYVQRRISIAISTVHESPLDAPPNFGGNGPGVAGSQHTVATALSALTFASGCVTAPPPTGRPPNLPPSLPEPQLPLVVTALRGLLSAATSRDQTPDESPAQVGIKMVECVSSKFVLID